MGYLNLVGSFIYKEPLFRSKLAALANNDAQLKTDGWAQNTKTLFYQAAVPAGWTQDVSQNDKALRVVGSTGGGVAGGTQALSTTITLNHTHAFTTPADGSHTHSYANHTHLAGAAQNTRASTNVIADSGGFMYLYVETGGSASITEINGTLATVGALTLSTLANHDHGAPASALTDIVFAYCDVLIGTKNAPGGTYTDLTNQWHTNDKIDFDPFSQYAANDAYNLGNLMPAATVMLFGQASAPAGWTKIASTNDRMLRVVSGVGGGTGGTQLISAGVNLTHTHAVTAVADHTHSFGDHQHLFATGASSSTALAAAATYGYIQDSLVGAPLLAQCNQTLGLPTSSVTVYRTRTTSSGAGSTTAAGGHTHVLPDALADFTFAYLDVIQCSKDSAGAPYAYTDYTAEFAWKKLVSYQRLNTLAKNDEYLHYHTTPSATMAFFYMGSPPAGWVKMTTQHDKALRIVSGGSGGSPGGGSQLLSSTIALAHTHSIPAQADHSHTAAHTHPIDTGTKTIVAAGNILAAQPSGGKVSAANVAASPHSGSGFNSVTENPVEVPVAAGTHSHGGITDQQLTDVVLAYADVIWCTKS